MRNMETQVHLQRIGMSGRGFRPRFLRRLQFSAVQVCPLVEDKEAHHTCSSAKGLDGVIPHQAIATSSGQIWDSPQRTPIFWFAWENQPKPFHLGNLLYKGKVHAFGYKQRERKLPQECVISIERKWWSLLKTIICRIPSLLGLVTFLSAVVTRK